MELRGSILIADAHAAERERLARVLGGEDGAAARLGLKPTESE